MVKVVVLDVDGTLMDTNYLHTEAWARAFERAGHRVPRVRLHEEAGAVAVYEVCAALLESEFPE